MPITEQFNAADDSGGVDGSSTAEENAVVLRPTSSGRGLIELLMKSSRASINCTVEPHKDNIELLTAIAEKLEWVKKCYKMDLATTLRTAFEINNQIIELQSMRIGIFVGSYMAIGDVNDWPINACRVEIAPLTGQNMVVKVSDRWEVAKKISAEAPFDEEIPF